MSKPMRLIPLVLLCTAVLLLAAHGAGAAQGVEPAAPTGQSDLRVNEVMADNNSTLVDPDEPGQTPDWFELYNPGPADVSLNGLGLADSEPLEAGFVITDDITILAGGYLLFYADGDTKQGKFHTNFRLSASGESVILYNVGTKQIIDRIDFPSLGQDQSFGRLPDGSANLTLLPAASPDASNNLNPPHISAVTQPPAPPAPVGTPVAISAIVTDTGTIVNVTLHYSVTGVAQSAPMNLTGPDTYSAQIPAQPLNTLVTYHISATDDEASFRRYPLAGRDFRYLTGYTPPKLLINEVVVENDLYLVDPDEPAETPDWIELYNPGPDSVSLAGISLSDDKDLPLRFVITATLSLAPGQLMTFLADDDKGQNLKRNFEPPLHLNFNLKKSGTFVGIYGGQGSVLIDSVKVKDPPLLGAVGRYPVGDAWSTAPLCPTFNAPNVLCDQGAYLPTIRNK